MDDLVSKLKIGPPIGESDHFSVEFELNVDLSSREQLNYGLDQIIQVGRELEEVDWDERFRGKGADEMELIVMIALNELKEKYLCLKIYRWQKKEAETVY